MTTYLYNFDPLKPHFYIVKLGFTGVYIIFLISAQNIDCGYSLEPPRLGGSKAYPQSMFVEVVQTSTHNLCFEQKYEKHQIFLSENFPFLVVNFSIYLIRRVFVMYRTWIIVTAEITHLIYSHIQVRDTIEIAVCFRKKKLNQELCQMFFLDNEN